MLMMASSESSRGSTVGLVILLGIALGLAGAVLPLVPAQYRPMNFAVFGAVGLFLGSRAGRFAPLTGAAIMLGGKLLADLLNYLIVHPGEADYLPIAAVYLSFLAYPLLGWLLVSRSESYLKMFGTTALAGLPFFLVTNFIAWKGQYLPYPQTLEGLMQSYVLAMPFHSATLISDLAFGGLLFAAHTELSRAFSPRPIVIEVRS
jgi:hypothetical protein